MAQAEKWNGKSVYRLNLALGEVSRNSAALYTVELALKSATKKAKLEAAEQIVKLMGLSIPAENLSLGGWECAGSPTGKCIYDVVKDPWKDNCLICGDPAERQ